MGIKLTYQKINLSHTIFIVFSGIILLFFPFEEKIVKFIGANIFALGLRNIVSYHFLLPLHVPGPGRVDKNNAGYSLYYLSGYFILVGSYFFFAL